MKQEERMVHVRRIVRLDDLQRTLLEHFLFVAEWSSLGTVLACVGEVCTSVWPTVRVVLSHDVIEGIQAGRDFTGGLNACLLVPVIIGVLVVEKALVKTSTTRSVLWRRHACMARLLLCSRCNDSNSINKNNNNNNNNNSNNGNNNSGHNNGIHNIFQLQ